MLAPINRWQSFLIMFKRKFLFPIVLALITLAIFSSVGSHEFVWDDRGNITENPYLQQGTFSSAGYF